MKFLLLLILTTVFYSASVATSTAQDEAKVSFRVTRFDPMDRPSPKLTVGTIEERRTVEIPMTTIEGPITTSLRGGKYLDFFEGQSETPLLSVEVPTAMRKDLLLIFLPTKDTFKVLKVHAPRTRIRGGDRYIVNATKYNVGLQLGEMKPLLVKSSSAEILKGPGGSSLKMLPVVIKEQREDKWVTISEENWSCDPRFRSFLFIYRSPRTERLTFHGVADRLE